MAERILIAELEIDSGAVVKEQQELGKEIQKLTDQVKLARKEGKQYNEENIKAEASLKNLKKEYNANQRILQGLQNTQTGQIKTVAQARSAVSALSAEWAKSTQIYGENDARSQKLGTQLLKLNTRLKELESSTGNNTRKVGDYTGGIIDAVEQLRKQESELKKNLIALEAVNKSTNISEEDQKKANIAIQKNRAELVKVNKNLQKHGQNLDVTDKQIIKVSESNLSLKDAFGEMGGGANKANKALNILKANPIILLITGLVIAIRGLIKMFSRNEESVDRYNKIMKQLGAIIAEVRARVANFFKAFKNLLTLDFKKFGEEVKESFEGTADAIREAAAAAREIADLEVLVRKEIIATTKAQAERRKRIAELILLTRDETKSFEERRKALQEANALEVANLNEQLALQQKQVDLAEKELAATPEFERSDEQRLKLAQEQAKLLDLETASITRQRELLNRINELENKANAEQLRALNQVKTQQEEILKIKEDAALRSIELFEAEVEAHDAALQAELLAEEEAADKEIEINNQKLMAKLEADQLDVENRRALMEENLLADFAVRSQILEEQRQAELAIAKAVGADVTLINKRFDQQQVALEAQKQNAKLTLAAGAAGALATIFGQESKVGKAAAIVQTTIDTFKSAQAAYSALAGITIVGPVLGALAAAAAVAAGVSNINKIRSTSTNVKGGSISTPSVSAPRVRSLSVSSGRSASTGGATSLSASNLGASLSRPGTGIQAAQTAAIQDGVAAALQENPNVLILEEFQDVEGRQTEVRTESEL